MNLRNKLTKILSLALVGVLSCGPVVYAADNTTDVEITVEATEINITVPVDFSCVINPNIEEGFTYPDNLIVENNGYSPVMLSVAHFVDTTATFENDILPNGLPTGKEWNKLGVRDSLKYFSLGLYANDTTEWLLCKCEDTVYVKTVIDTTEADEVGVVPGESSVKFDLESSYGRSFKEVKNPIYKITWLAELYEEEEVTDVLLIDEEDSSVLNYDLTNTSNTASVVDFLDDLFGTKTVYADSNVSEINKSEFDESKVIGTAVITGLKDESVTEIIVADYYETSDGKLYKIIGIKEGTSSKGTITGNNLSKVTLSSSITEIPNYAFYNNKNLTEFMVNKNVTNIGEGAFYNCTNLKTVTFEEGSQLETIRIDCFYGCKSLTSITLPEGLTTIEDTAFQVCTSLENVTIPSSVNYIGNIAFVGTPWVETQKEINENGLAIVNNILIDVDDSISGSIVLPENIVAISGAAFNDCSSLTSITLPDGLTIIENQTFIGCSNLTNVSIPNTVSTIESEAFLSCNKLTKLTIPDSVTYIGKNAVAILGNLNVMTGQWNYTYQLTTVNYKGTEEQWNAIEIPDTTFLTNATINYNYSE